MAGESINKLNLEENLICTCCGDLKKKIDFYESGNYVFQSIGRLSVCKTCLDNYYMQRLFDNDNDEIMAIHDVCQLINIPYYRTLYNGVASQLEKTGKKTLPHRIYITKFNSMKKANSYPESFLEGDNPYTTDEQINEIVDDGEGLLDFNKCIITQSDVMFWGKRYNKDDLKTLKFNFSQWCTRHKSDELAEQVLFKQICITELEIEKDRDAKKNVDKKVEYLQKLMTSANVRPSDQKSINSSENQNALGIWIMDIEKCRPAEYFENQKLYSDFDGIGDYFKRFLLRPLKNLLTGSRDFDVEFNVMPDGIKSSQIDKDVGDDIGI